MKIPEQIIEISRKLRKNMTDSEKVMWKKLKTKGFNNLKFLRQFPIKVYTENNGFDRYIICDFICREHNLIIELDGSIHNLKEVYNLDRYKEELLKNKGFKIIRFKNEEICEDINKCLEKIAASFPG